jgi:hypothetical protein
LKSAKIFISFIFFGSSDELDDERLSKVTIFSVAVALKRKLDGRAPPIQLRPESRAKRNWKRALSLIRGPRSVNPIDKNSQAIPSLYLDHTYKL